MKVKIGPYRHRWVSYVHDKYMDRKYGRYEWEDNTNRFERYLEKMEDALQAIYNATLNRVLDKRDYQKISVRIDPEDFE